MAAAPCPHAIRLNPGLLPELAAFRVTYCCFLGSGQWPVLTGSIPAQGSGGKVEQHGCAAWEKLMQLQAVKGTKSLHQSQGPAWDTVPQCSHSASFPSRAGSSPGSECFEGEGQRSPLRRLTPSQAASPPAVPASAPTTAISPPLSAV